MACHRSAYRTQDHLFEAVVLGLQIVRRFRVQDVGGTQQDRRVLGALQADDGLDGIHGEDALAEHQPGVCCTCDVAVNQCLRSYQSITYPARVARGSPSVEAWSATCYDGASSAAGDSIWTGSDTAVRDRPARCAPGTTTDQLAERGHDRGELASDQVKVRAKRR